MSIAAQALHPFFKQFALPNGLLGQLAGLVMARENARANERLVELLNLDESDQVLELGCGPGVGVARAATRATRGHVSGVDPSSVMVAMASRRNAAAVKSGLVDIAVGSAELLPYRDEAFTVAFALNSVQHWNCVREGLAELTRVLAPGGRILLARRVHRADRPTSDPHAHGATDQQLVAFSGLLNDLGFAHTERRDLDLGRETLAVFRAERPR